METNADMIPSIRIMSELYDVGYKEAKPLKNKEAQTPEIKNLAVSALFIGSHENLLFDDKIKSLFKKEFSTKLARRSFFSFTPEEVIPTNYKQEGDTPADTIKRMLDAERKAQETAMRSAEVVNTLSETIANCNLSDSDPLLLTLDDDAMDIYDIYQRYNTEMSCNIDKKYPISMIVRKHAHWKALKLAGAFAIFECGDTITKQDLIHAISYVELIDGDMRKFEEELVKEKYEVFCDYMKLRADKTGKSSITLHLLKKLQYIPSTSNPTSAMKTLIDLASSYDPDGIYTIDKNVICYEQIIRTDVIGASFLPIDNSKVIEAIESGASKEEITRLKGIVASQTATGYTYAESSFPELSNLLAIDLAFTPFKLKDGIRGRENIASGTTWVCFDVDDTPLTDEEMHFMLGDINHHIARTSDKNNPKKYRVIIQLDASVDVNASIWKYFIQSLSNFLQIPIDKLPQSQIFFGYNGRDVLSVTDQSPIEIKNHIMYATSQAQEATPEKPMTPKERAAALSQHYTTFEAAFNANHGEGSRKLYGAAWKAHQLGATYEEIVSLIHEISEYWDSPFPPHRLEALERQIKEF